MQELRAASAERIVDVAFEDRDIAWMPERADVRPIRVMPGRTVFAVPAGTSAVEIAAAAGAVGPLAEISFAPPSLDEVFIELVAASPNPTAGEPA